MIERQDYKNTTIDEARSKGFDVVQLKYDGWWTRIELTNNEAVYYSRTQREFKRQVLPSNSPLTLLGESMQGTQWSQEPGRLGRTYLFDIVRHGDHDLTNLDYRSRYGLLRAIAPTLPDTFTLVPNYPISLAHQLWDSYVEQQGYEGLVFRKSTDPVNSVILRCKKVVTADLQITGFYEGQGKYAGTLGGVNARTAEDVRCDVGGGFSDELRDEIWRDQTAFLGRWFEIEARAKFESGSFRHPNFIRWRPDRD